MNRMLIAGAALCVCALTVLLVVTLTGREAVSLYPGRPSEVDGNKVTVYYIAHPTDSDPQAEVEETADSVTITVTVHQGCSGDCPDQGVIGPMTVTLDEPLGSRTIKDGSED